MRSVFDVVGSLGKPPIFRILEKETPRQMDIRRARVVTDMAVSGALPVEDPLTQQAMTHVMEKTWEELGKE